MFLLRYAVRLHERSGVAIFCSESCANRYFRGVPESVKDRTPHQMRIDAAMRLVGSDILRREESKREMWDRMRQEEHADDEG